MKMSTFITVSILFLFFTFKARNSMGNKQTQPQQKQFIQHQKLGSVRIFQVSQKNADGEQEQIQKMQILRNIVQKDKFQKWAKQLNKINDSEGQELFLVPQTFNFQKAGFCGSSGVAKLTYNKFEFVLSSQIKNRNNLNKYFDQTQIWYVLYNLVRAGNKFELLKQKIGDIHPNNILINEDGQTAIISKISIPEQEENFAKLIADRKAEVFLAPEQMKVQDIDKGIYNQKIDKCLAQVFSLGMTLLSAGTLQHCNDVYQREPCKINTQRLNVLISHFQKRYSPYLTATLRSMLQFQAQKRVRSKKLYETLRKYQNEILDLQPFPVNSNTSPQLNRGYVNQNMGYHNQPYLNNMTNPPAYNPIHNQGQMGYPSYLVKNYANIPGRY